MIDFYAFNEFNKKKVYDLIKAAKSGTSSDLDLLFQYVIDPPHSLIGGAATLLIWRFFPRAGKELLKSTEWENLHEDIRFSILELAYNDKDDSFFAKALNDLRNNGRWQYRLQCAKYLLTINIDSVVCDALSKALSVLKDEIESNHVPTIAGGHVPGPTYGSVEKAKLEFNVIYDKYKKACSKS